MSRSKLNSTTDIELRERVLALTCIHDRPEPQTPAMLAPFVTNDVLHRLHEVCQLSWSCTLAEWHHTKM